MDPDAVMADILRHLSVVNDDRTSAPTRATHGEWLAERVEQLDTWLITGGYLPRRWQPVTVTTTTVEEVQRELDAHPTWTTTPSAARDAARERCSFTTLAGTTSWSERCVGEVLRGER